MAMRAESLGGSDEQERMGAYGDRGQAANRLRVRQGDASTNLP
jgi:hypothetical protein